ncbi:MAG TPA: hypothetical protein VM286_04675 [Candidatus Thermoplasmatota archaeon]|nr:hypothetical protein [Candidatus Thermoplasmatota archaeon]
MEGPRKHQAGERKTKRAVVSSSASARGANVYASRSARRLRGTAAQRNRGFNPLGTSRVVAHGDAPGARNDTHLEGTDRRAR